MKEKYHHHRNLMSVSTTQNRSIIFILTYPSYNNLFYLKENIQGHLTKVRSRIRNDNHKEVTLRV